MQLQSLSYSPVAHKHFLTLKYTEHGCQALFAIIAYIRLTIPLFSSAKLFTAVNISIADESWMEILVKFWDDGQCRNSLWFACLISRKYSRSLTGNQAKKLASYNAFPKQVERQYKCRTHWIEQREYLRVELFHACTSSTLCSFAFCRYDSLESANFNLFSGNYQYFLDFRLI